MDPQTDLPDLVEDLEVNIDELSSTLQPLLSTPLHTTASSLPLLDKAKLYVLAAYSIESLLFSTLQASGVNAKEHAIFAELARLKGYFGKVKEIEERGNKDSGEGRARLDVGAAQRFIKHGLAGNERYDAERKERMAKEKARAQLKAKQINKKFDDEGQAVESEGPTPKKRGVDEVIAQDDGEDHEVLEGLEEPEADAPAEPATKKARVSAADLMDIDSAPSPASQSPSTKKPKRKQRGLKKKKSPSADTTDAEDKETEASDALDEPAPKKKARKQRGTKKSKLSAENTDAEAGEETILSKRAPKTRSETFNALLDGSLPEKQNKGKGKGKGKSK